MDMNKNWKQEYQNIENELFTDKINVAMKKTPNNWRNNLEEIGFTWVDDNKKEAIEEQHSIVQNVNQEYLVAYFENHLEKVEKNILVSNEVINF